MGLVNKKSKEPSFALFLCKKNTPKQSAKGYPNYTQRYEKLSFITPANKYLHVYTLKPNLLDFRKETYLRYKRLQIRCESPQSKN